MYKLLTEEIEQEVSREYGRRRAVIALFALILVLATGIVGFLPSYLLSSARESEVLERIRIQSNAGERGEEVELKAWLSKLNLELHTLTPDPYPDQPSVFIKNVLDQKTANVRLTSFSWVKVKNKVALSVDGIALDRQALIAFENSIESSEHFSGVTLPISNLAQDKDIDFQIKFAPSSTTPSVQKP